MKRFAVLMALVLVCSGCSKQEPTQVLSPSGVQSNFIVAEALFRRILVPYPGFWNYPSERVTLYSKETFDIAQCSARMWLDTSSFVLSHKWVWPGGIQFGDSIMVRRAGAVCSLVVTASRDSSFGGGVVVPGPYLLREPPRGDTLAWGDVRVTWLASPYATWYEFGLTFVGDSGRGYGDTILVGSDTTVLIPQAFFSKDPTVREVSIEVWVHAHAGAVPGGVRNIVGAIPGVFFTTYVDTGATRDFYMTKGRVDPWLGPPPRLSESRRQEFILRAFGVGERIFL